MKRKPSEFAVNSFASMMSVLQYDDLDMISSQNIFNEDYPCHIYMICRRPRVIIVPEMFQSVDDSLSLTFNIQKKDGFEKREVKVNNPFGTDQALIETKYPYNTFVLKCKGDEIIIKSASLLQNFPRHHFEGDFLVVFDVLDDIGQHRGVGDGGRAHAELAVVIDQQNAVKRHRLPGLDGQAFDLQCIARADAILFATCF